MVIYVLRCFLLVHLPGADCSGPGLFLFSHSGHGSASSSSIPSSSGGINSSAIVQPSASAMAGSWIAGGEQLSLHQLLIVLKEI